MTAKEACAAAVKAFMTGKFDEAIALYGEAHAAEPGNLDALRGLAMVNGQMGKADEAVAWATKMTEVAASDPMAWATLSMLLQKQGKIKEAEDAQAQARVLGWKAQLKKPPA